MVKLVPSKTVEMSGPTSKCLSYKLRKNIVEEFRMVPQGQFSERNCTLAVYVPVPQVDVQVITNAIEALQFHTRAISNEIQ